MSDKEKLEKCIGALMFYANPEIYFAIAFLGDPPCGAFADDFDDNYEHDVMEGERPGKLARKVLDDLGFSYSIDDFYGP